MHRLLLVSLLSLGLGIAPGLAQALLSPSYSFTQETFTPVIQALPASLRAEVAAHPHAFLDDYRALFSEPQELLSLVDRKTALPSDYEPKDLVKLRAPDFPINHGGISFRKAYLPELKALLAAAKKAGLRLTISSGYRSWAYQKELFEQYAAKDGLATAERYSARPGQSQHQLGTVIDFGSVTPQFGETPEGKWMAVHAADLGFSISYPEGQEELTGYIYEPWHFRYIGIPACKVQQKWFGGMQQWLLEFNRQEGPVLKAALK